MKKKLWLTVLVLAVLLVGCKSGDDETLDVSETPAAIEIEKEAAAPDADVPSARPVTGDEVTTIIFAVPDWKLPRYERLVEKFEAANPDLRVRLVTMGEVLRLNPDGSGWPENGLQRLASAADVIEMPTYPKQARLGLVRDLSPFIEADPAFEPEDFYPGSLESFRWQGSVWSLPTTLNLNLIFFDKDAFDEVGEPYPEPGWTWDDFGAKAKALTARAEGEVTRWGFVQPRPSHVRFVEGRVGSLVDENTDPPTPHFDRPEVVEAVRWYVDLYLGDQSIPFLERPEPDEAGRVFDGGGQELIDAGKAAMWNAGFGSWQWRKEQGNVGVVPFPVDTANSRTSLFYTDGLSMSAGTMHPDAAWRWMHFLTRQSQGNGPSVESLPARRSVAEASGIWDDIDEELVAALRYAVDHGYASDSSVSYDALFRGIETVLKGEKSVEDALAEAQIQAQADVREEIARQAKATPMPAPVVAPLEEDEAVAEGAVSITFVPGVGSSDLQRYQDAARRFHEIHPDIIVNLQNRAEQSDCFRGYPGFQDPEPQAAILNLEPFLDTDSSFTTDDFYVLPLDEFTWQGQLWGLPAQVHLIVIEYNKDLFDAAGMAYPAVGWTMDDFLETAMALTTGEGEDKQYGFVADVYEGDTLMFIIDRLGGRLFDDNAHPPAATFDDPATVEAVRWYTNLSTLYGVKPIFVTDYSQMSGASFDMERETLINKGRAAMWTSSGDMSDMEGRNGLNIGVVPLPTGSEGDGGGMMWSTGYFISAQTENRQACWEWIKFLTQQVGVVRGFPARRSVAESDAYRQQVGAERAAAYLASITGAEGVSVYQGLTEKAPWLSGTTIWLSKAYGQILEGEASVEEALAAAQKLADDYRACIITRDAFSDQQKWQACMEETDPNLSGLIFEPGEE